MNQENFKNYYNSYWKEFNVDEEKFDEIISKWSAFRSHILAKDMTPELYNGSDEMFNDDQCSLRKFLEWESTKGFFGELGSMVSGKLCLFPTIEEGNKVVYYKGNKVEGSALDTAVTEINDFLYGIVTKYNFDDLLQFLIDDEHKIIENIDFPSFIFEIIFLNSVMREEDLTEEEREQGKSYDYQFGLVQIHDYKDVETNECFKDIKNIAFKTGLPDRFKFIQKSKKLCEICKTILSPDVVLNRNSVYLFERAVWECTHYSDYYTDLIKNNKNLILYGAPGTGKTFTVKRAIRSFDDSKVKTEFVQFHPSFTYEDFIEGIRPLGIDSKTGVLNVGPVNGVFKSFCIEAKKHPDSEYYFIADEINRANLSAVFGETLSLLEEDYRYDPSLTVDENKKEGKLVKTNLSTLLSNINADDSLIFAKDSSGNILFGIPKNIHFIGMMNDADKSIDAFDIALRRRFAWILMSYDEKALFNILTSKTRLKKGDINLFLDSCKKLNYFITGVNFTNKKIDLGEGIKPLELGRQYEIGHAIYKNIIEYVYGTSFRKGAFSDFFDKYIKPTISEYIRTYSTEAELENNLKIAKTIFIN